MKKERKEAWFMKKTLILFAIMFSFILFAAIHAQAKPLKESDVDFSGMAQFIYGWDDENSNDQMDIPRLMVYLKAQPAEKVSIHASLDFSGNNSNGMVSNTQPAGARNAVMDGTADDLIVDLYADLNYLNKVTVRVGQFPLPVSYELNTPEYDLETIQYSQGVGTFGKRDRGFVIFGDPTPTWSVSGWLVNGDGAITGATDSGSTDQMKNERTDYGVQLDVFPVDFFSIKLWGGHNDSSDNGLWTGTKASGSSFGFGMDYAENRFHAFGEYSNNDTDFGNTYKTRYRDWFIHASYLLPDSNVQPVLRYDVYKIFNNDAPWHAVDDYECTLRTTGYDCTRKITTLGLNWNFAQNAKFQIMRDFVKGPRNDKVDAQLTVRF